MRTGAANFWPWQKSHGLEYVADADFNYRSGRFPEDLAPRLVDEQITGRTLDDTVDLFCYRQLHSPILTRGPFTRDSPNPEEFADLLMASCLVPSAPNGAGHPIFQHPSGYEVEAKEEVIFAALRRLRLLWPRGLRIGALFPDVTHVMDDLKLLHRNGLIELRCLEPGNFGVDRESLNRLESHFGGYITSPYHTREAIPTYAEPDCVAYGEMSENLERRYYQRADHTLTRGEDVTRAEGADERDLRCGP